MPSPSALLLALAASFLVNAAGVNAKDIRKREQDRAFEEAQKGAIMPLPQIEQRVLPKLPRGATYLGPEFNGGTVVYRLKYIADGKLMWLDVDARTGRVLRQSGN